MAKMPPPKPAMVRPQPKTVRRPTFLRQWRKYRGLTLEQAAERADMTAGNLSAMERGTQGYTQSGLEALAEAYNAEPGWLLNVDPTKDDAMWSLWERAAPGERQQIIGFAKGLKARAGS